MAIFYFLTAEMGKDEEGARAFEEFFKSAKFVFEDGRELKLSVSSTVDDEGFFRVSVHPEGASYGSYNAKGELLSDYELLDKHREALDEVFYALVKEAPQARYVWAGCERDDHFLYSELKKEIQDDFTQGLILSNEIWKKMGSPDRFKEFSERYRWDPE